jgi:hypothetical protein
MSTGDVAAGKDHHHEGAADGKRRDDTGRAGDDRAADGEDRKKVPMSSVTYLFMAVCV